MTDFFSAKHHALKARKWATGTLAECPDGSAKHWAEIAEATAGLIGDPANRDLSNLTDEGLSRLSNLPLFISFKTGHIMNNASYVNGRYFSWLSGTVYTSAYQALVEEYQNIPDTAIYEWSVSEVHGDSDLKMYTRSIPAVGEAPDIYYDKALTQLYTERKYTYNGEYVDLETMHMQWMHSPVQIQTKSPSTSTVAGVTITYYLTDTKKKICLPDQHDALIELYNATGAADFYLLDPVNQQFKLPRRHARRLLRTYKNGANWYDLYSDGWVEQGGIKTFTTGETLNAQVVTFPLSFADTNYTVTGLRVENADSLAFSYVKSKSKDSFILYGQGGGNAFNWKAQGYADTSLLSDEFEYEYYFVGNTVQNQTFVDVSTLVDALPGKTDVDFGNAAPCEAYKSQASAWSLPSGNYVDLSLGATGTKYTAPANGWFYIVKATTQGQYFIMDNNTKLYSMNFAPAGGNSVRYLFPVQKDDVISVAYTVSGATSTFRFIYAEGEI